MKVFKRIWWLLTAAPVNITELTDKIVCDHCGEEDGGITQYTVSDHRICQRCIKKLAFKVLGE